MIQPIPTVNVVRIVREISTVGSSPLFIMADDNHEYYVKTTLDHPCIELINEVICGYFLQLLNLNVPPFALARVNDEVFTNYIESGGKLNDRYKNKSFENKLFFASQKIDPVIEFEEYVGQAAISKHDFQTISNPLDIIKIGLFDIWVGNKDRKLENPNILLRDNMGKFVFCPIDHTAAFAHCTDYKQVTDIFVFLEEKFRILRLPFVKSISKWLVLADLDKLNEEMINGMEVVLLNLNDIFAQIPTDWGFSKKAKEHLSAFLSNKVRNEGIIKSYNRYLT